MPNFDGFILRRATLALASALVTAGYAVAAHAQAPILTAPTNATGSVTPPATTPAAPEAPKPWVAPATFGEWASAIKLSFQGEAGIIGNTDDPRNQTNFGQLFTDKSNRPVLNQFLVTASRDLDTTATGWEFGFKLQLMYGSDARIIHNIGVFDQLIHDRNQFDVVEANGSVRIPVIEGGIDLKVGIYPTPLGVEVIDPKGNAFYSKSYIYNYGLPFKHSGGLAIAHVSPMVDLYGGVDTGVNTFTDNNSYAGYIAGVGLTLLGGNLTVLALTHIGVENPSNVPAPYGNAGLRYLNDLAVVYKATDKLTFTTEVNYIRDDGYRAEAFGAAQYVAYALNDQFTLNGRAEVFRDQNNFFVSNPNNNRDYINFQRGSYSTFITAAKPTTYSELTLGVTYKPEGLPAPVAALLIRPELRYDRALNNSRPYGDRNRRDVFTLGTDVVLGF